MTTTLDIPQELLDALDNAVSGVAAIRRQIHALQAAEALCFSAGSLVADAIARAGAHPNAEMAYRMVASDFAAAIHESDRTVATRLERSTTLTNDYPKVYRSLSSGRISVNHAHIITDAGAIIFDAAARAAYEAEVLSYAEVETTGRLRPVAKELAERFAARTIDERHAEARSHRRVCVVEREDGMADLIAVLPAVYAYGVKDRLDQIARLIHEKQKPPAPSLATGERTSAFGQRAGNAGGESHLDSPHGSPIDSRSMDEIRADVFTDLLLSSDLTATARARAEDPTAIRARVQVIVPVARVSGHSEARTGTLTSVHKLTDAPGASGSPSAPGFSSPSGAPGFPSPSGAPSSPSPSGAPSSPSPSGAPSSPSSRGPSGRPENPDSPDPPGSPSLSEVPHFSSGHDFPDISAVQSHVAAAEVPPAQPNTSVDALRETHSDETNAFVSSLAGYGPIDSGSARSLAGSASSWQHVRVDENDGGVLSVETYRPSAKIRQLLGARDQHCRFPGCRTPLRKCDLDHTIAASDGGPTSSTNLAHVCRRHHTMKHATPWKVTQDHAGVLSWVSPTGRISIDQPVSRVRFRAVSGTKNQIDTGSSAPPGCPQTEQSDHLVHAHPHPHPHPDPHAHAPAPALAWALPPAQSHSSDRPPGAQPATSGQDMQAQPPPF